MNQPLDSSPTPAPPPALKDFRLGEAMSGEGTPPPLANSMGGTEIFLKNLFISDLKGVTSLESQTVISPLPQKNLAPDRIGMVPNPPGKGPAQKFYKQNSRGWRSLQGPISKLFRGTLNHIGPPLIVASRPPRRPSAPLPAPSFEHRFSPEIIHNALGGTREIFWRDRNAAIERISKQFF